MKEQVLTITTSAFLASLMISMPAPSREPSMISASTRFLAQPREIRPTRTGRFAFLSSIEKARQVTPSSSPSANGINLRGGPKLRRDDVHPCGVAELFEK